MTETRKVIFIEDDLDLGKIICMALQSKGYEVDYANTLTCVKEMIKKESPHALILDLEVGHQNALDYLPFIRSQYPSLLILIASSHHDGEEITRCYQAGANQYVKKPYDIQELDYLLHTLRVQTNSRVDSLSIGAYQLRTSTHELFYNQELIKALSPKEYEVLYHLAENKNQPVDRKELLQEVWQNENADDSLNNIISCLRKYLSAEPGISLTKIKGVGYKLEIR